MRKQIQNYVGLLVEKRGVSMVIALALLSVISIIALTSTFILTNAIRGNTGFGDSVRSQAAAEAGVNLGLMAVKGEGVGTSVSDRYLCISRDGMGISGPGDPPVPSSSICDTGNVIEYSVSSSAEPVNPDASSPSEYIYIIPPPGQGNAGENCIVKSHHYVEDASITDNQNLPCNWSKLYYGESVQIPLYIALDPETPTPADPAMSVFTLKVRTPCKGDTDLSDISDPDEGIWCPDGRYTLHDSTPSTYNASDVIVNWQIIGDCYYDVEPHNRTCVGIPRSSDGVAMHEASDITIEAVNFVSGLADGLAYAVLNDLRRKVVDLNKSPTEYANIPPNLSEYLVTTNNSEVLPDGTTERVLYNPVLYLSVVSPLIDDDNTSNSVPYIEYQLMTDVPIASSFQSVYSTGTSGDFMKTLRFQKPNDTMNVEFVLQN